MKMNHSMRTKQRKQLAALLLVIVLSPTVSFDAVVTVRAEIALPIPFQSNSGETKPKPTTFSCEFTSSTTTAKNFAQEMKEVAKKVIEGVPERVLPKPSMIFRTIESDSSTLESNNENSDTNNKGVPERIARKVKFRRCAVVGNGGVLKSAEFGEAIDAHDVVFRQNQAPTATYEAFVGEKTTFRVLNKKWTQQYSRGDKEYLPLEKDVYLIASRGVDKIARNLVKAYPRRPDVRIVGLESAVRGAVGRLLREFKSKVDRCLRKGFKPKGGNTPSSGMISTVLAMSLCDEVNLYGFGIDDRNVGRGWRNKLPGNLPEEAKYQYYVLRGTERNGVDAVHSMELEHAVLDALVSAGYINKCGAGKNACGLTARKKPGKLGERKDLLKAETMYDATNILMREKANVGKDDDDDSEHSTTNNFSGESVSATVKALYGDDDDNKKNKEHGGDKIEEAGELDELVHDDDLDEDDTLTKMWNLAAFGVKFVSDSFGFSSDTASHENKYDEDDPLRTY